MNPTVEILKKAFKTSHDDCRKDCPHAEALCGCVNEIEKKCLDSATIALVVFGEPMMVFTQIFIHAFHVGYRTRELVEQAEKDIEELNKITKGE